MRTRPFLLALLASTSLAQAQQRQPANVSTLPTTNPQEFDLLDNTGAWVKLNQIDTAAHAVTGPGNVRNLISYGADPTGANDSCPAATAALAGVGAAGVSLRFPAGSYRFASNCLDVTNKPIAYIGDGPGVSTLIFPSATAGAAGITVANTNNRYPTIFRDFKIVSLAPQTANAAINVNVDNSQQFTGGMGAIFENLAIGNFGDAANYWYIGIKCNSCANAFAKNVMMRGKASAPSTGIDASSNMKAGFSITGYSFAFAKIACGVYNADVGEEAAGDVEGNIESGMQFIAVNYGWWYHDKASGFDPNGVASSAYPGPVLLGGDSATYKEGFRQDGWSTTQIIGGTFYRRFDSTIPWVGIHFNDGLYGTPPTSTFGAVRNIVDGGTQIYGYVSDTTDPQTNVAIEFGKTSTANFVRNTSFNGVHYAVSLDPGMTGAYSEFISNNTYNMVTAWAPAASGWVTPNLTTCPTVYWSNNAPVLIGVMTGDANLQLNNTTPCITPGTTSGARGVQGQQQFLATNSSATSITNFLGGVYGQQINVMGNDGGLTTLVHNAALLILKGSTSVVLANGNVVTLVFNGVQWRETARNF